MRIEIHGSCILYPEHPWKDCVWDYKEYILSLLCNYLESQQQPTMICFMADAPTHPPPEYRVIKMGVNFEHTLVHRGVPAVEGDMCVRSELTPYLLRIQDYNQLQTCDFVVEYSYVNMFHVHANRWYHDFYNKLLHIPPCIYPCDWAVCERSVDTLTTFVGHRSRRKEFLEEVSKAFPHHRHVTDVFDPRQKQDLYKCTKIMINIHQCIYHNTFEEVRVLPCLMMGVLVVSEDTPYRTRIPYHHMIIWVEKEEQVIDKVTHVLMHYKEYCQRVFTEENRKILEGLHAYSQETVFRHLQ